MQGSRNHIPAADKRVPFAWEAMQGLVQKGRAGGIRTHTGVTPADFKSAASTVSPPPLGNFRLLTVFVNQEC